jgi:hypothetical protein
MRNEVPSRAIVEVSEHGIVHGGQAPVVSATVAFYAIGATSTTAAGYNAPLGSPLVSTTSDSNGNWSVPSYTCTPGDELYVVASGGEPSGNTTPNSALVLTMLIGPCGSQFPHAFLVVNEITTVVTAYALSGFSSDYLHIGTTATNLVGLTNAAANVPNLINISTGAALINTAGYANPLANTIADTFSSIVPFDTINTLANILSTCVNAAGGAGDPACTALFSYTGGANSLPVGSNGVRGPVATNTADAAIYIAHNPGLPASAGIRTNNVVAVWALPVAQSPFGPFLPIAPNDWTLVVNYIGGGLGGTTATCASSTQLVAIDGQGNAWTVNPRNRSITELNPQGTPLSPSTTYNGSACTPGGWGSRTLTPSPKAIAFDLSNNAWVADATNCLVGFSPSGTAMAGSPFTAPCSGETVSSNGVQADTSGNIWVTGLTYVTSSTPAGALRSGFPFTNVSSISNGVLYQDYASNMWFIDQGTDALNALALSNGAETYASGGGFLFLPAYAAVGTLAASEGGNDGLAMFVTSPSASVLQVSLLTAPPPPPTLATGGTGGTLIPSIPFTGFVATDGNSRIYLTGRSTTPPSDLVEVYDNAFNQVSPEPTGYTGGTQQSFLYEPSGLAVDQSGNLWVVNLSNDNARMKTGPYGAAYHWIGTFESNLDQFIGVAIPVNPVAVQNAANQTYGTTP